MICGEELVKCIKGNHKMSDKIEVIQPPANKIEFNKPNGVLDKIIKELRESDRSECKEALEYVNIAIISAANAISELKCCGEGKLERRTCHCVSCRMHRLLMGYVLHSGGGLYQEIGEAIGNIHSIARTLPKELP